MLAYECAVRGVANGFHPEYAAYARLMWCYVRFSNDRLGDDGMMSSFLLRKTIENNRQILVGGTKYLNQPSPTTYYFTLTSSSADMMRNMNYNSNYIHESEDISDFTLAFR